MYQSDLQRRIVVSHSDPIGHIYIYDPDCQIEVRVYVHLHTSIRVGLEGDPLPFSVDPLDRTELYSIEHQCINDGHCQIEARDPVRLHPSIRVGLWMRFSPCFLHRSIEPGVTRSNVCILLTSTFRSTPAPISILHLSSSGSLVALLSIWVCPPL